MENLPFERYGLALKYGWDKVLLKVVMKIYLSIILLFYSTISNALIIDDVDWYSASLTSGVVSERVASVGRLILTKKLSYCSATVIAKDIVITNYHCVGSEAEAENVSIKFFDSNTQPQIYDCDELVYGDKSLDYSLLKCKGDLGTTIATAPIDDRWFIRNKKIYLVHFNCDFYTDPMCDTEKLVSPGELTVPMPGINFHNADTLNESSGSPIFDIQSNKMIALHKGGVGNLRQNGRGFFNRAVPMYKIMSSIRKNVPKLGL